MHITISGAQSVGKSTLINALKQRKEIVPRFKIFECQSRKAHFNHIPINDAGNDASERTISALRLVDSSFPNDAIYDRSLLDSFVYTTYLYNRDKVTHQTFELVRQCFLLTNYDLLFYIPPEFPIVNDGIRSDSKEYQDEICKIFENVFNKPVVANRQMFYFTPIYVIGSVEKRVEIVLDYINKFDQKNISSNLKISAKS